MTYMATILITIIGELKHWGENTLKYGVERYLGDTENSYIYFFLTRFIFKLTKFNLI